jgi:uncharacterized membrane protein YhdT
MYNFDFGSAGQREFSSLDEIIAWRQTERDFWARLIEPKSTDAATSVLLSKSLSQFYSLIDQTLSVCRTEQDPERVVTHIGKISSHIYNATSLRRFVFSWSVEGRYIAGLSEKNLRLAAYTACSMLGIALKADESESVEGSFLALSLKHGIADNSLHEREALHALRVEWDALLSESKSTFSNYDEEYIEFRKRYLALLSKQQESFADFKSSSEKEFRDAMTAADVELKKIATTYDEKLALQAPVAYWEEKAEKHSNAAKDLKKWCIGVGIVVAIFIAVEVGFAVGTAQKFSDLPMWEGSLIIVTTIVGIWAIRILVRLLLSNLHLKSEAEERRTMLLTYLALLREGQGPTEQQRELLLHILFRPSSTGIIKDDALPPWIAQWIKSPTNPSE